MTIRDHPLAWRWTDSRYALLPDSTLALKIEPVDLSKAEELFRRSLRLLGRDCLTPEIFETVTRSRAGYSKSKLVVLGSGRNSPIYPQEYGSHGRRASQCKQS